MKISTILDYIDSGHVALPEFQRGYVWNREQVRGLFDSLYRGHPVGGLLVWVTEPKTASQRGGGVVEHGVVKLLLDGQQRITTLYGVVKGRPPKFFDGNAAVFRGLRFHVAEETFAFYQPVKMKDDPLWIDVSELFAVGPKAIGDYAYRFSQNSETAPYTGEYVGRLSTLLGILGVDLYEEQVTGKDKTLDVVVDIFNRVNSGGTKLSKGDLALAKICADWPQARDAMKEHLRRWNGQGYRFNLDWLLRSVNTVLTGEAKFSFLHDKTPEEIEQALARAAKHVDTCLNLIGSRFGLDHDEVLFGKYAIPVMVRYLDQYGDGMDQRARDMLLLWFLQAGMWGRFSGSTESLIDQDLAVLEGGGDALVRLLEQLRLWHGGLRVEPGHFAGGGLGARFYPVLYMLTRSGEARDFGSGIALKHQLLGKQNSLEVHHIFPKAQVYKAGYSRAQANAIANFCFLTKGTNLKISDRLPEEYLPEIEEKFPGVLASQWIPMDRDLWTMERYPDFLAARRELLAAETNLVMEELLHGDVGWIAPGGSAPAEEAHHEIGADAEDDGVDSLNRWVEEQGLPRGSMSWTYSDPISGEPLAEFDLVWENGLQHGYSQPVVVQIGADGNALLPASQAGFRCFSDAASFKKYVLTEVVPPAAD